MDSTCRLCAEFFADSSSLTSVFSLKNGRLIVDMIIVLCPIKIDLNDSLPHRICKECLKTLIKAIELREKSVQSDANFRSNEIQRVEVKKEQNEVSSIYFENECESNPTEEEDEEDYDMINYEPRVKRVKTEGCELCGRAFNGESQSR